MKKLFCFVFAILYALLAGCTHVAETGVDLEIAAQATQVRPNDGMTMIYIPEGKFTMGMKTSETLPICEIDSDSCLAARFSDEEPVHTVYLNAFWIDQTEVTNGMYASCVSAGVCPTPWYSSSYHISEYYGNPEYDAFPVMYVSWEDATLYCNWVGARLPTEAEWEKAARGIDGRIFPWGNQMPMTDLVNTFDDVNPNEVEAVGSHPAGASPYGVLDMSGNVNEWVADWYRGNYYTIFSVRNPLGPRKGDDRVYRGGASTEEMYLRAASRNHDDPRHRNFGLGFRCAQTP